jgi:nucleoside-diphosphate-sugar epimerase
MISSKVLVTGATGYIGSSIMRRLTATPNVTVFALTRQPVEQARDKFKGLNVQFVQGDCLKAGEIDHVMLEESTAVIHSVGAITDAFDYK